MALQQDVGAELADRRRGPGCCCSRGIIISRMVPLFRIFQTKLDAVNRIMREQLTGVRVVRAFVREDIERTASAAPTPTSWSSAAAGPSSCCVPARDARAQRHGRRRDLVRRIRIEDGTIEIGTLFAFMQYLVQILMGVLMATFMTIMIPRAAVSAERISEVLASESTRAGRREPVSDFPGAAR